MGQEQLDWIAGFIWGIADDVLRDVYVRGKYRDVILPMTVIRRLDAVLEKTKKDVLATKALLDGREIVNQDAALRAAAQQPFYNTSPFSLRSLGTRSKQQQLKDDFEAYLLGFSPNVQEILDKFKFRNQIPTLVEADILGFLIEKYLDPSINLSPDPVHDQDGNVRIPGLDNHGMGTVFEELLRRFNEENNEEAGEHFTPRDVVQLMSQLIFVPIADQIVSGTYWVYDGAVGTGGMVTIADETLTELASRQGKEVSIHLFGQEINPETYAIAKADLLLKGEGGEADNIKFGSTLSADAFPGSQFDFMLSNPPYGKSWKTDLERMGGRGSIKDPRFVIEFGDDPEFSLVTRSSDGQLMFLVNLVSKMMHDSPLGSRIAEVHNGSSLFTGDAGQGESNIRRWIIENDWLEAIIALPVNMFYNTGIATYIWVLSNRKPKHRQGKVQLIDATEWSVPLRKNMGQKNCELSAEDTTRIVETFLNFEETDQSKIFPNQAFGYWKITVERPLRLRVDLSEEARVRFRLDCRKAGEKQLPDLIDEVSANLGDGPHLDFNVVMSAIDSGAANHKIKLNSTQHRLLRTKLAEKDESAQPVIKKIYKPDKGELDPLHGCYSTHLNGESVLVEYEPDTDLRDTEQVPLLEDGGIEAFFHRDILPHVHDAWVSENATKIGYQIPFSRYFYKPEPLRTLDEIRREILALETETDGLLDTILGVGLE